MIVVENVENLRPKPGVGKTNGIDFRIRDAVKKYLAVAWSPGWKCGF